ncbi:hypothetical protein LCGC14_2667180, partial [marine sediment metagenome]
MGYLGGNAGYGQGPGGGVNKGGAGYGGKGGTGRSKPYGSWVTHPGGPTYGAYPAEPTFGSGGGSNSVCGIAGNGGGAIKIFADSILNNGEIFADGKAPTGSCPGGGSGGGIYLISNNVFDLDNIYARGGENGVSTYKGYGGGGGGGRITISAPWITGFPSVESRGNGETGTV